MTKKIKIHFVCRGNVFRSRLAEAYARSILGDEYEISSSGIEATRYPQNFLSPWTKILSNEHGLTKYLTHHRTQTNSDLLNSQDIIVFMSKDVFEDAQTAYDFEPLKSVVWRVNDREDWATSMKLHDKRQRTYKAVARLMKQLANDLNHGGWLDIVSKDNEPLGFSLPVGIASKNAAWHRGSQVIITTPSNKTLVEKRSKNIIFSPSLIDISLGGHVDVGEQPDETIVREVFEELGLEARKEDFKFLEIYKHKNYRPRYKKYSCNFTYVYHLRLNKEDPALTLQREEVELATFLSLAQLKRLLRNNRLKNLGMLSYNHAFYKRLVQLAHVVE
jgi:protein-tyrosine-phosphatase/8-oxo-dGTP pyrophosphatase MutT (NUDIX family)